MSLAHVEGAHFKYTSIFHIRKFQHRTMPKLKIDPVKRCLFLKISVDGRQYEIGGLFGFGEKWRVIRLNTPNLLESTGPIYHFTLFGSIASVRTARRAEQYRGLFIAYLFRCGTALVQFTNQVGRWHMLPDFMQYRLLQAAEKYRGSASLTSSQAA
jgi:hypothetical protein